MGLDATNLRWYLLQLTSLLCRLRSQLVFHRWRSVHLQGKKYDRTLVIPNTILHWSINSFNLVDVTEQCDRTPAAKTA
ncbi:hypothetical protein R1flu_011491 [Riccia fluitans]|uniref:Secreted protein n=1 Tax=Riccia fluitans TaxID=41844 RepID=A0ABD1Z7Y7_9MARC